MNSLFPILVFALVASLTPIALALFGARGRSGKQGLFAAGLALILVGAVGAFLSANNSLGAFSLIAVTVVAGLSAFIAVDDSSAARVGQFGGAIALILLVLPGFLPGSGSIALVPSVAFAAFAACLAGGIASAFAKKGSGVTLGVAGLVMLLCSGLASFSPDQRAQVPWILATIITLIVAQVLSLLEGSGKPKTYGPWAGVVAVISISAAGFLTTGSWQIGASLAAGGVSALLTLWLVAEGEERGLSAVALLLWLGASGLGFALAFGQGVALLALGGIAVFLVTGRLSLLGFLAPALVVSGFRFFRESYPDITRAFEIGQHYAFMGVIVGAILVVALADVLHQKVRGQGGKASLAALLIGLSLLLGTFLGTFYLGEKGSVGVIAGLCLAPGLFALIRLGRVASLLSAASYTSLFLAYPLISGGFEVDRQTKIALMTLVALAIVACLGVAIALTPKGKEENAPA
ncbi:MAG: hypothetical protein MUC92_07655 [Fimbriimonadaceae bacterium]|jgi:FtsH-binding integral membrane protein|nr:hypothetical protein [Fimbriimonadaceae bacterium]